MLMHKTMQADPAPTGLPNANHTFHPEVFPFRDYARAGLKQSILLMCQHVHVIVQTNAATMYN